MRPDEALSFFCLRKKVYESERRARAAALHLAGQVQAPVNFYECRTCSHWHIGKHNQNYPAGERTIFPHQAPLSLRQQRLRAEERKARRFAAAMKT